MVASLTLAITLALSLWIKVLGKVRELEQTFDYPIMDCNYTYSMGSISWEDMKD